MRTWIATTAREDHEDEHGTDGPQLAHGEEEPVVAPGVVLGKERAVEDRTDRERADLKGEHGGKQGTNHGVGTPGGDREAGVAHTRNSRPSR